MTRRFLCLRMISALAAMGLMGDAHGQEMIPNPPTATQLEVVISSVAGNSDSLIVVPPVNSISVQVKFPGKSAPNQKPGNVNDWLSKVVPTNGLMGATRSWHLIANYDQFDEGGHKIHHGTLEELWIGPHKYKRTFSSDDLIQTDVATDNGLFRSGDQRWPNPAEMQIRAEIVEPFHHAATLRDDTTRTLERTFGTHSLDCVLLENPPGRITQPTQYCFDHDGTALRYSFGSGWDQTTFNNVELFEGRYIARDITVTHGGTPWLRIHIQVLEPIAGVKEDHFVPPADAVPLQGQRVKGVPLQPSHIEFPEWPDGLRQQQFTVTVELVIGKNGRVLTAHAITGPKDAYKTAENTVRKWTFPPYLVLGEPAEVETKVSLSNN